MLFLTLLWNYADVFRLGAKSDPSHMSTSSYTLFYSLQQKIIARLMFLLDPSSFDKISNHYKNNGVGVKRSTHVCPKWLGVRTPGSQVTSVVDGNFIAPGLVTTCDLLRKRPA